MRGSEVSEEGDPPPTPPIPSAVEELGSPLAPEQGSSASGRGEGDDRGDEGDNEGGSEGGGDDDGGDAIPRHRPNRRCLRWR